MNKGHGSPVDWWCLGILTYEMLAGIDPFSDDDPMAIYQKILKGKIKFPRDFDKKAKSFVKHLLVADTTKRFGCMKDGIKDIKEHKWFSEDFSWEAIEQKTATPVYIPTVKDKGDTENFSSYPDSPELPPFVSEEEDPFKSW